MNSGKTVKTMFLITDFGNKGLKEIINEVKK